MHSSPTKRCYIKNEKEHFPSPSSVQPQKKCNILQLSAIMKTERDADTVSDAVLDTIFHPTIAIRNSNNH
eukprot:11790144-Ditylum_brightwellii.AAC.1